MNPTRTNVFFLLFFALVTTSGLARENTPKASFLPYELLGDWQFTNTNGVRYRGDVRVSVESGGGDGAMHGRISYDGQQTNDKCTTKPLFTDLPVDVEAIKVDSGYRLAFQLKCLRSESPRAFNWTLTCENGVCVQATTTPNGRGLITLRESR